MVNKFILLLLFYDLIDNLEMILTGQLLLYRHYTCQHNQIQVLSVLSYCHINNPNAFFFLFSQIHLVRLLVQMDYFDLLKWLVNQYHNRFLLIFMRGPESGGTVPA